MQALCSITSNSPYAGGMKTGRPSDRPRTPFGERLYNLREEAGLTQAQVADKLGISHRAYAFWEREPTAIRAEQLAILADLFQVSADLLIGRDAPKPRGSGPTGKLRQVFDTASKLPRRQQQRIINVVEDMLVARSVNGHSNGN
jgi:transcriptional regulator with XRE-family HTH domain